MNISLQNIDKVSGKLTVKLEKADYQDKVEKALKTFRQKAQMPGFRPGMVPMGLIKKQYGTAAKAEEINKQLQDSVYNYLKENNVNMLGEPLPSETQDTIDFATQDDFEFEFDIALAPEFTVALDSNDHVAYYRIEANDELIDRQVKMYTQRAGQYEKVDSYQENDMLKGLLAELDENGSTKEGGIQVEGAVMMPAYMKNDDQKALFANAKVNDVLVFNPNAAYNGSEVEDVAAHTGNFSFQVEEMTRFVEATLSQEIFDQVFGENVVKSEEEFRAKIKESLEAQFSSDSDYKFLLDLRGYLMEKIGKLEFPDALLKRIMLINNQDKGEEFVNENYDKSIEELTWHLIKEDLVKQFEVKIENDDVMAMAKNATKAQFAQYGMMNVPEDVLENYSKEMLKKKESVDNLVNRAIESKLAALVKEKVALDEKKVSLDEFNKMFE